MKAGVLIAGSLAWDQSKLRDSWRSERLRMDEAIRVRAPIRYGRLSKSRDETYTMVFSTSTAATGVGLAVPFSSDLEVPADLLDEATCLWRVECKKDVVRRGTVSARWGSVAVVINPDSSVDQTYLEAWRRAIHNSPQYGSLQLASQEAPIVDASSGISRIPWPCLSHKDRPLQFDLVLITATNPTLTDGSYPSPRMLVEAWRRSREGFEYFDENQRFGILTSDDDAIRELRG